MTYIDVISFREEAKRGAIYFQYGGEAKSIKFSKQKTGFGEKYFFICPTCGGRRTNLYIYDHDFVCRSCTPIRVYKGATDTTKNGYMNLSYRMRRLAEKNDLDIQFPFCYMNHPKPKRKHEERWCDLLAKLQALANMRNQAIFFNKRYSTEVIQSVLRARNVYLYVCDLYDLYKYFYDWDVGYTDFPGNKGNITASGLKSNCTPYQRRVLDWV